MDIVLGSVKFDALSDLGKCFERVSKMHGKINDCILT